MQLYMSWYIISFFGFTFLNIFIFSSTLVLTFSYRRNLYTFYSTSQNETVSYFISTATLCAEQYINAKIAVDCNISPHQIVFLWCLYFTGRMETFNNFRNLNKNIIGTHPVKSHYLIQWGLVFSYSRISISSNESLRVKFV